MLVTFTSSAYADITMFGDVAVQLLKLMGHSGTVPGAFKTEDIPLALEKLQRGIEAAPPPPDNAGDDDEESVSLRHRALPLIDLMKAAAQADCVVMWDRNA
jgi:hypothetical protein